MRTIKGNKAIHWLALGLDSRASWLVSQDQPMTNRNALNLNFSKQVAHSDSDWRLPFHSLGRVHPRCVEVGSRHVFRA